MHTFNDHLMAMPVSQLVDFIYWDNHGGANMDVERGDWTIDMILAAITEGYTSEEFATAYAAFLEDTE